MFLTKLITSLQSVFTKRATGYIGILLICGMTFALYSPSLFFDFLAISDQNLLRKSYNFDYSTWINEANAITFLSFTFNQTFTGFSAFALRLTSLLIHLINTILVFYFTHRFLRLRKRRHGNQSENRITALFTALFFGTHPLNSEAVTWISARESLIFGVLIFSILNLWISYIKTKDWFIYGITISLSLVLFYEQVSAVILLPILVFVDVFLNRKYQRKPKRIIEKIPFILLTIHTFIRYFFNPSATRQIQENIQIVIEPYVFFDLVQFQFFNKVILACYALGSYILKTIFPLYLSKYYPYPVFPNENISPQYQLFMLLIISILLSFFYLTKHKFKEVIFGLSFMFIVISPFLPFYGLSDKLMQDAYYYTASYGAILALTSITYRIIQKREKLKVFITFGVLILGVLYAVKTLSLHIYRYDEFSIRNHSVGVFPESEEIRQKRVEIYILEGHQKKAVQDLNFILDKRPIPELYVKRGEVWYQLNDVQKACQDYQKAEELKPKSSGDKMQEYCTESMPKTDDSP